MQMAKKPKNKTNIKTGNGTEIWHKIQKNTSELEVRPTLTMSYRIS